MIDDPEVIALFQKIDESIIDLPQLDVRYLADDWTPNPVNWLTAHATVHIDVNVIVKIGMPRSSFMQVIEAFTFDLHKLLHRIRPEHIPFPVAEITEIPNEHVVEMKLIDYPRECTTTLQCLAMDDLNNLTELIVQASEALGRKLDEVLPGHHEMMGDSLAQLHSLIRASPDGFKS